MKHILLVMLIGLCCVSISSAQDETYNDGVGGDAAPSATDTDFVATVEVDSAFVRLLPSRNAEAIASVFEDEMFEVVSRNLDGTWFEIRRKGRMSNLGWVYFEMIDFDFRPEYLPLGDYKTGLIGINPLVAEPPTAVFLLEGPTLRNAPFIRPDTRIMSIPPLLTLPVLMRNQNATWLYVNYLGHEGWIASFTTRRNPRLMELVPLAPNLPSLETIEVIVIPPEIQLAELEELRSFINPRLDLARNLEGFWWSVFRGETMPCEAPPFEVNYAYGDEDVQRLPEIARYTPRLAQGIAYLNLAITPLHHCGVLEPSTVIQARDSAINAKIIFEATLGQLDNLEAVIRRR